MKISGNDNEDIVENIDNYPPVINLKKRLSETSRGFKNSKEIKTPFSFYPRNPSKRSLSKGAK
jgi:hypothetical protein